MLFYSSTRPRLNRWLRPWCASQAKMCFASGWSTPEERSRKPEHLKDLSWMRWRSSIALRRFAVVGPDMKQTVPAQVSVILGTYNRLAFLRATIASVRASRLDIPYEIIVVDGGSTDGTIGWLM